MKRQINFEVDEEDYEKLWFAKGSSKTWAEFFIPWGLERARRKGWGKLMGKGNKKKVSNPE